MAKYKNILVEKTGKVATLMLNRVEVHNALDSETISEMHSAIEVISKDNEINIIVLRGNGKSFCSGADIRWFRDITKKDNPNAISKLKALPQLLLSIYNSPKVTVAAIHGSILGGGIGLVSAYDFVVGEPDCQFAFREVKLGIIPATISPFVIQKMGSQNGKQLMLTGEYFDGSKAKEVGLISHLAEKGKLRKTLDELIEELKSCSPHATKEIKKGIVQISEMELNKKTELLYDLLNSKEAKEGIAAFFEKRKPYWNT